MHRTLLGWAAGLFLLAAVNCVAQEVSAGITGHVTDPSRASIAGTKVNAKDLGRGTDWPTTTNEDGIHAFPRVPVGRYELRVEAQGFKTWVNSEVVLELNQRARLDVTMQVGTQSESISVTGEAPVLQTDTTQVGSVINTETVSHTPLISWNPVALTLLTAGVATPDPSQLQ